MNWHYRIAVDLDEAGLTEYGENGWELVTVVQTPEGLMYYFKMPRRN